MNILGKEIKMKKISIIASILLVLVGSANAFISSTSDNLNTYDFYGSTYYTWDTLEIFYE